MENLDPNQLPILPDPAEPAALPSPTISTPISTATAPTPWFRTKRGKFILGIGATIAVLALVLFSQQIGQLLNLFGTKAAQVVSLNNTSTPGFTDPAHEEWNSAGQQPDGSLFVVDPATGRLMLNNPGFEPPQ